MLNVKIDLEAVSSRIKFPMDAYAEIDPETNEWRAVFTYKLRTGADMIAFAIPMGIQPSAQAAAERANELFGGVRDYFTNVLRNTEIRIDTI